MGTGEKSVVVKRIGKGVIVDSGKQMCRWVCMAHMLYLHKKRVAGGSRKEWVGKKRGGGRRKIHSI
jgi:hypothetical protein